MAITKGIVSGGNYTFSAANQSITFSSDYLGMSLSDITYITNIKSGVATVIYDPFDTTKGGVLNGLVLTLAYNTTLMVDTDPLQIIVGFTPNNATPLNVAIAENSQLEAQTELLQNISEAADVLKLAQDKAEQAPLYVSDINQKRDERGASVQSDNVFAGSAVLFRANDALTVDTTGYNSVVFFSKATENISTTVSAIIEGSVDGKNWIAVSASTASGSAVTAASFSAFSISSNTNYVSQASCTTRYIRLRLASYFSGSVFVEAHLRTTPYPAGLFTTLPTIISQIGINVVIGTAAAGWSAFSGVTGIPIGGVSQPGVGNPAFPVIVGGTDEPNRSALSGLTRPLRTDTTGRPILGTDFGSTAYGTVPPRGVGGRPNSMQGSQTLLVEDVGQSEGDTMPMLLQQILVELKMLNQQINELPFTLNLGIKMQNEVSEYRTEEYNNHVNNQ